MQPDSFDWQGWAEKVALVYWRKAEKTYGSAIGTMPEIHINPRLRTTAGRAFVNHKGHQPFPFPEKADFNARLIQKYPNEYMIDTIPHELAHFIAYRIYGEKHHGKDFYAVCISIGARAERCHNMK